MAIVVILEKLTSFLYDRVSGSKVLALPADSPCCTCRKSRSCSLGWGSCSTSKARGWLRLSMGGRQGPSGDISICMALGWGGACMSSRFGMASRLETECSRANPGRGKAYHHHHYHHHHHDGFDVRHTVGPQIRDNHRHRRRTLR